MNESISYFIGLSIVIFLPVLLTLIYLHNTGILQNVLKRWSETSFTNKLHNNNKREIVKIKDYNGYVHSEHAGFSLMTADLFADKYLFEPHQEHMLCRPSVFSSNVIIHRIIPTSSDNEFQVYGIYHAQSALIGTFMGDGLIIKETKNSNWRKGYSSIHDMTEGEDRIVS